MRRAPPRLERRHYALIAETLQALTTYSFKEGVTAPDVADEAVRLFQQLGKRTNGEFKPERFLAACTPGNDVHARTPRACINPGLRRAFR